MFAQGADDVIGQRLAFVDPAADLADVALLAFRCGLGLDVVLVVGVGHGLPVGDNSGLGDGADEHAVGAQIHVIFHLQAHEGVDIPGQEPQAVVAAQLIDAVKLVGGAAALEAVALEHREGCGHIQAVDIHHAGLLDDVVGIILLVDADRHTLGVVGQLGDGVNDEAVVPAAIVGGHHIQTVTDVEEGFHVILVGGMVLLGQVVTAQFLGHSLHLGLGVLVQGGEDLHGGVGKGDILGVLEHALHDLGGQRCPGAVLDKADGTVLEIPLGEPMDVIRHEGENIRIIGSGCQNQLAITESILHGLCHVGTGQVMDHNLGAALFLQLLCQQFHGGLGVAVNRGIGNDDALALHPVGGPDVIQIEIVAQILGQHGTVEGADGLDIQGCGLLQQGLDLRTVLTNDADVVAAGFACPGFFHIQGTELAKTVSGEQNLVIGIIGHDDFGPVDHGGGDEGQHMLAQAQGIPLPYHDAAVGVVGAEEILHHGKSLGRRNHHSLGIELQELVDVCGMVGLHVLDHQIVGLAADQDLLDIVQPLVGEILVHGVHDRDLLVQDHIGIVCHAIGDYILAFEQVNLMVVDAYIFNIVGNHHSNSPSTVFRFCFVTALYTFFLSQYSDFITETEEEFGEEGNRKVILSRKFSGSCAMIKPQKKTQGGQDYESCQYQYE